MIYNSRTERKRRRIVGPEALANIDEFLTELTSPDFSANDDDFLAQGHAEVREDAWAGELNQFSQEIELKTDSVAVSPFHCRHTLLLDTDFFEDDTGDHSRYCLVLSFLLLLFFFPFLCSFLPFFSFSSFSFSFSLREVAEDPDTSLESLIDEERGKMISHQAS